jgi:hypothetical protein
MLRKLPSEPRDWRGGRDPNKVQAVKKETMRQMSRRWSLVKAERMRDVLVDRGITSHGAAVLDIVAQLY